MELTVRVPGSCGELVQGTEQGNPFLVTCPINCYTTVRVSDAFTGIHGLGRKSLAALESVLTQLGQEEFPWGMRLVSELPHGKGMASSSADIAATAAAAALAFGKNLLPAELMAIAVAIEPTDGIFYPGCVKMNQLTGEVLDTYPELPALQFSIFDTGGTVDTRHYHAHPELAVLNAANEPQITEALCQLERGRHGDEAALAGAASLSALANQAILPKERLPELLQEVRQLGALGVNAAHSGTVIGVLWSADQPAADMQAAEQRLRQHHPELHFLRRATLISGGVCGGIVDR